MDLDLQRKGKSAVIKTSTRQVATPIFFLISSFFGLFTLTYFLPVIGLVEPEKLKPGDLVVRKHLKLTMSDDCSMYSVVARE